MFLEVRIELEKDEKVGEVFNVHCQTSKTVEIVVSDEIASSKASDVKSVDDKDAEMRPNGKQGHVDGHLEQFLGAFVLFVSFLASSASLVQSTLVLVEQS